MSSSDAYTDVVELCAMLQCLGFSVKSLDTSDTNLSQDGATRTIIINCQSSGLHVVLESGDVPCSCPTNTNQQNSGFWQVSGVAGGKQLDKEYGSALLGSLPKAHRERLTKELQDMVRCIKLNNESDVEKPKRETAPNKSASMLDMKTPEKRHIQIKLETPKRYRSLDTLTLEKATAAPSTGLPSPGVLQKQPDAGDDTVDVKVKSMGQRQSTYTLSSTSGSMRRSNKTSSPIKPAISATILDKLIDAEKIAEDLKNKLSVIIREFPEDTKVDSSMSSLMLDVSKISVLKGGECSKHQFASSPNLAGLSLQDDLCSKLKKGESISTPKLDSVKTVSTGGKSSRLRKISPNIFKLKKENPSMSKLEKLKSEDANKKSRLCSLLKSKTLASSAQASKSITDANPNNISASRKKFSHIKSTIPRPAK